MAATTRFLVAGDTGGDLARLFARVGAVNAKHGPFAFLLCVGDFLGAADASAAALAPYLSGDAAVPLPTYVLASRPGEPDPALAAAGPGGELAPQLFYLGSAGVAELSGLRVAYLSGGGGGCSVDPAAVGELRAAAGGAGFGGVDVLLTCAWPRGFYLKLDPSSLPADLLPDKDLPEVGLEEVAELAVKLRPRYHFCGGEGAFWQRPPYRLDARSHACRMVGLSRVQEDKKQTWLKAFGMVPQAALGGAVPAQPEGTTDCPYPYAALTAGGGGGGGERRGERAAKRQREEWVKDGRGWIAEQCWFCTSSTQFESHLVTSVGDEAYLTIAKGPLVPHHSLLVPVAHKASSLDLSAAEAAEVRSYISAVRRCFAARGEALLAFERYLGGSSNRAQFEHMHLQLVPLPHDVANGAREAFEREGASRGVRFELLAAGTRLSDALPTAEPFFAVELPSGETLLHKLATNQRRHPLQFGREVIAQLIGKPERSDWKRCLPQEQPGGPPLGELERELASSFQEAFAPFAPTFD